MDGPTRRELSTSGLNALLRGLLGRLRVPVRNVSEGTVTWSQNDDLYLVPTELERYWTGHSGRHFLPSVALAIGVPKADSDFVGRWNPRGGATDYAQTAQQVVASVQVRVCRSLLTGSHGQCRAYDERDACSAIFDFVAPTHGEAEANVLRRAHITLKQYNDGGFSLGGAYPSIVVPLEVDDLPDEPGWLAGGSDGEDGDDHAPFFVTISKRTRHRKLHSWAGCHVMPWQCKEVELVHSLSKGIADSVCRTCASKAGLVLPESSADSSSSGDSSSTESDAPDLELQSDAGSFVEVDT